MIQLLLVVTAACLIGIALGLSMPRFRWLVLVGGMPLIYLAGLIAW
ncbi:MAG: hypothetical protein LC753_08235 [Acidobacteria bacterium]|nr:hypothetical protein [Acidobacteriota bacterium]MCA1650262.1 hypothetical protein [Acidobacteriota bacterium]